MTTNVEKFTFKYEGNLEYIDFDTLLSSQFHFTEAIKQIKEVLVPDAQIKIKVKALPPGSFPVEIMLDLGVDPGKLALYGLAAIGGIGGFAASINSIIELYKNLKGNRPESITINNNVTVIQMNSSTYELDTRLYEALRSNENLRDHISKTFEKIDNDDEVTGIKIMNEAGDSVTAVDKKDFVNFSKSSVDVITDKLEDKIQKRLRKNARVRLLKVVFERGYKWQVIFEGYKINASISDERFILDVESGKLRFANGDSMLCDLRIDQKFNRVASAWMNDTFNIVKVHEVIPRHEQSSLDFEDDDIIDE